MMLEQPLWEHFIIKYRTKNVFDWLGNGRTKEEVEDSVSDWSPYLTL